MKSRIALAVAMCAAALLSFGGIDKPSIAEASKAVKWGRSTTYADKGILSVFGKYKPEDAGEIRLSAIRVDLKDPGIHFVGTGRSPNWGKPMADAKTLYSAKGAKVGDGLARVTRERTADFMARLSKPTDSGGRGLNVVAAFPSSTLQLPWSGKDASPAGLIVSEGVVVAEHPVHRPLLVVRKDGSASIQAAPLDRKEYANVQVAHTGHELIRVDGEDVVPAARNTRGARVAAGVTKSGRYLWVVAADDGVRLGYGTGANYHDLNVVFESLGCSDAMCLTFAGDSGIYVKGENGAPTLLNKFPNGGAPGLVTTSIGVCVAARRKAVPAAAPKAAESAPKGPEQVSARFSRTRLAPMTAKGHSNQTLNGQVAATFKSDLPRFKRPVLYVAALYDVDGLWRMYDVVCGTPGAWYGHLLSKGQTPAQISRWQMEVSKDAWSTVTFGDSRTGFFNDCGISPSRAKLIGYRLELWQNGGLVRSFDSAAYAVRSAGAPEDWHVKGKYPDKIAYRWPPPPEK